MRLDNNSDLDSIEQLWFNMRHYDEISEIDPEPDHKENTATTESPVC